jgi:hypothetical protein
MYQYTHRQHVHPTYGFIDFDGATACALSEEWAARVVKLSELRALE